MKCIFIILFLSLSIPIFAQSQERNAIKVAMGISRLTQEQVNAPSLMLTFHKDFYPRTLIELNATLVSSVDVSNEEELRKLQSYRFGMGLLFKVVEDRKQAFNAGLGFSAGFYGTDYVVIATEESGSNTEFNPGFSAIVEYSFILPSQWFVCGRVSVSRFDGDRGVLFLAGGLGYRF